MPSRQSKAEINQQALAMQLVWTFNKGLNDEGRIMITLDENQTF